MQTPPRTITPAQDPLQPQNPLVTRRWLLGGVGVVLLGSIIAIYFALLLLFWQGQWQLVFHPSASVTATPATRDMPYEDVRFDATEAGATRLTGWWIPAAALSHQPTAILFLHDAHGSLTDALPDLAALHALGYDIFAFDPRGYGRSQWARPSEHRWLQDADAALYYLASVRHIGPSHLVIVGRGLGGTIAAELTARNRGLASLVMIDPQPPTLHLLEAPRWTRILPVRLLAADIFDPATALASPAVDKFFLVSPGATPPPYIAQAAQPATMLHAAPDSPEAATALRQFIGQSPAMRGNGP